MDCVRIDGSSLVLEVTVLPRASRTEIAGVTRDRVRIRLAAPPVDGRANSMLIEFLATEFRVPAARVTLVKGLKSRRKTLRIDAPRTFPGWLQAPASGATGQREG